MLIGEWDMMAGRKSAGTVSRDGAAHGPFGRVSGRRKE